MQRNCGNVQFTNPTTYAYANTAANYSDVMSSKRKKHKRQKHVSQIKFDKQNRFVYMSHSETHSRKRPPHIIVITNKNYKNVC